MQTILIIFDLLDALILPTKFRVIWSFGSAVEMQNDFQSGGHLDFRSERQLF